MAKVVYTGVAGETGVTGSLFEGAKFWLSHRVPSRATFIEQIKSNGGEVVPLEKNADIKIVDHLRLDNVPETYSYQYIERSVRNGELEDLDDHRAGPSKGVVRAAGAIGHPTKGTRTAFSAEDDRVLYDWAEESARKGGFTSGAELYKQLEQINARHTWQSWRDRWVKTLSFRPRPAHLPANAPPTPPTDQSDATMSKNKDPLTTRVGIAFTSEDAQALLAVAGDIMKILLENQEDAWQTWSDSYPQHSAQEWRNFWEANIKPIYRKREKLLNSAKAAERELSTARTVSSTAAKESSPLIEADSVEVWKEAITLGEVTETRIAEQRDNVGNADSLAEDALVGSNRSPKRKHMELADGFPSSSPRNPLDTPPRKRRCVETGNIMAHEIPSTPERSPLSVHLVPRQQMQYNIIDLEDDNSEIKIEAVDDKDEEDKDEDEQVEDYENDDYDEDDLRERIASPSLSEPGQTLARIRSIFRDPRQITGLEIPSPEGGWDEGDKQDGDVDSEVDNIRELTETKATMEDTQAILRGRTPAFDFSIAEPDEGWDMLKSWPPSSPPIPVSLRSMVDGLGEEKTQVGPTSEEEIIAHLERWMDARMDSGIDVDMVGLALKCSNNHPELADIVLESMKRDEGIPTDVQGIWTEEDDECLEAVDARKINAMIEKHGQEELDKRFEFLRHYNAT